MIFEPWIVWRYVKSKNRRFFNLVSTLSILGMALGVATLVLTMAVISGFETTLHKAVIDVTGHMLLIRRGEPLANLDNLFPKLKEWDSDLESAAPFVQVEGMVAHKGKLSGVIVEGFLPEAYKDTLNLHHRLVSGKFETQGGPEGAPFVVLGRALAEKLGIHVGDQIPIVLPKSDPASSGGLGFTPRLKNFTVAGIVDLGMYEYDSRFILTSSRSAQELGGLGPIFTGVRLKFKDPNSAIRAQMAYERELGLGYYVNNWSKVSPNLFKAIQIEKKVIFVVLLFMTLAACFNISSTLFVSVLRRYGDISVFRVLGATHAQLMRIFSLQGLFIGLLGSFGGLLLGLLGCLVLAKTNLIPIPYEVYHLRRLPIEVRWMDLAAVLVASFLLCFVSTLAPAIRGAKMDPIEGLKYE